MGKFPYIYIPNNVIQFPPQKNIIKPQLTVLPVFTGV